MGLWRARALSVEVQGRRMPRFSEPGDGERPPRQAYQPYLHLLAGDDSGARTQLEVPFNSRCCCRPCMSAAHASSLTVFLEAGTLVICLRDDGQLVVTCSAVIS